jgi:hypothetical protein
LSLLGEGRPDLQGEGFQLWLVEGVSVNKAADCDVRTAQRLVQVFGEVARCRWRGWSPPPAAGRSRPPGGRP